MLALLPHAAPLELHLLSHTHADVGWLQTPGSLARVNVTRILDGVVGNLANDTAKRRRFVWDEMYFLEWWWTKHATTAQQNLFRSFVADGRIEFVDKRVVAARHGMHHLRHDAQQLAGRAPLDSRRLRRERSPAHRLVARPVRIVLHAGRAPGPHGL
jgi:hypothetical protein